MSLVADLRYAVRGLVAKPLFVTVAVLSLALGIGVNTAIFSLFHQVVMKPLPVHEPSELVVVASPGLKAGSSSTNGQGDQDQIFSYPMFRDLERTQQALSAIAAHRSLGVDVAFGGDTRNGSAMLVSGGYFDLLGVRPAQGRLIAPSDDVGLGASPIVVLSHGFWKNALGADPDIVGKTLLVNGLGLSVVGIAPEGFSGASFGVQPLLFVPVSMRWALAPQAQRDEADRKAYWLYVIGRRHAARSLEETESALDATFQPLLRNVDGPLYTDLDPEQRTRFDAGRIRLLEGARGQSSAPQNTGRSLALLLGTSALVLLIACLNIANLMLARGASRAGEFAVRASIGASRGRLLRQLLLEATLLGVLGAVASLPMALFTLRALVSVLPVGGVAGFSLALDGAAIAFTALTALATVLLFGLFPALQLARTQPMAALRGSSGQAGGGKVATRFRAGLAIVQVAFSMTALALAGLFTQSLANLRAVDVGMQVDSLATFMISPQRIGYTAEGATQLYARLEAELGAVPGVESVSASLVPVLAGSAWGSGIKVQGVADTVDGSAMYNEVGPDFFDTFGVPLVAGRGFERGDDAGAPKVAIVNRALLRQLGLDESAVGRRITVGDGSAFDVELIGVVADSAYNMLREGRPSQYFLPWRQREMQGEMNFYVRSALEPAVLLPQLRAVVAGLDPNLPMRDLRTLPEVIDSSLGAERFVGTLSASLAGLATVLAALGLYGVLSYTLAQRMRELGLRLALGAAPQQLRSMVLGQVARMTLIGAALGLVAALALGRAAQAQLFGLESHDPRVLAVAAFLLVVVSFGAGYGPARRAARIDPMLALRHD
jgi:predicted permease